MWNVGEMFIFEEERNFHFIKSCELWILFLFMGKLLRTSESAINWLFCKRNVTTYDFERNTKSKAKKMWKWVKMTGKAKKKLYIMYNLLFMARTSYSIFNDFSPMQFHSLLNVQFYRNCVTICNYDISYFILWSSVNLY